MATDVFYAATADGYVSSANATYATARTGSGLAANDTDVQGIGGQRLSGGTYTIWEGFESFDTSSIPDTDTVSSAILALYAVFAWTTTKTFEVRLSDWGVALSTVDWVAGADLAALTLLASRNTTGWDVNGYKDFSDTAMSANVNKTGFTRMLIHSADTRTNTAPTGNEHNGWSSADEAGTTQDPKLTVTHVAVVVPRHGFVDFGSTAVA